MAIRYICSMNRAQSERLFAKALNDGFFNELRLSQNREH